MTSQEDVLYYLYDPKLVPPARNKYIRVISELLAGYYDSSYINNIDIMDVLRGGAREAVELCRDAREVLSKEPTVLDLNVGEADEMVFVGDIHGQFNDLLHSVLSVQLAKSAPVYDTSTRATTPEKSEEERSGEAAVPAHATRSPPASVSWHRVKSNEFGSQPEKTIRFLFLGDYVDRGPRSVEVIVLLLALKIEYPQHVFLLRGNHEEAQTSRLYGFYSECRAKVFVMQHGDSETTLSGSGSLIQRLPVNTCDDAGRAEEDVADMQAHQRNSNECYGQASGSPSACLTYPVPGAALHSDGAVDAWMSFNATFCWLPLAAVVRCCAGCFFCAHGGLSPTLHRIPQLLRVRRETYGSAKCETTASSSVGSSNPCSSRSSPEPPSPQENSYGSPVTRQEPNQIIDGLLWSDPAETETGCRANVRGCGYSFGADVTRRFLDANYGYLPSDRPQRETGAQSEEEKGEGERQRRDNATATPASAAPPAESQRMQFIMRAHQCVRAGYQWTQGRLVVTVFSAPNYCGMNGNKGAIAMLRGAAQHVGEAIELEFKTYDSFKRVLSTPGSQVGLGRREHSASGGNLYAAGTGASTTPARPCPPPNRNVINNPILEAYFGSSAD